MVRTELTGTLGLTKTVAGFSDSCGPSGFTRAERATLPLNPFTLTRSMVVVVDEPTGTLTEFWVGVTVK
jgi:hypothetical protein